MSLLHRQDWISPEEYLVSELASERPREYVQGAVYKRPEVSTNHCRIAGCVGASLIGHLRGTVHEAMMTDMKVRVLTASGECFYYPDVLVNSDPHGQEEYFCRTPSILVEVSSPETERVDRVEKRFTYELIPTLHTYILIMDTVREVTVFRKAADGTRETEILRANDDKLRVPEIGFSLALEEIYRRTGL